MTKKLSQEFVADEFTKAGCELLEEYKGNRVKMRYVCNCGNIATITYTNFHSGKRCNKCGAIKRANSKKRSTNYVKFKFEKHGCILLEKEYSNRKTKMQFICKCGRNDAKNWQSFIKSPQCVKCGREQLSKNKRMNFYNVKTIFKKNGCKLLENNYKNNLTPMRYICECGEESKICLSSFQEGSRCQLCGIKKRSKKRRLNIEFIKLKFEEGRCKLIEKIYTNNTTRMKYKCECGKIAKISWVGFKKGTRCPQCTKYKIRKTRMKPDREIIKKIRKKYGNMLRNTLLALDNRKTDYSVKLLGYTPKELKDHLKNHPDWDRIKDKRWSIDHIFPIKAFIEYKIEDVKVINSLDNLQPMLLIDNMKKSDKYNKEEFAKWLKTKNIILSI